MSIQKQLLFSNLLKINVRCENGIDHGPIVNPWMHPPVHRILGFISRPSNIRLQRDVWRLDQLKGLSQQEAFVKGPCSISDNQTLERFPTLINSNVFNRSGQRLGLIADFLFELKNGKIQHYLVSRTNPFIPGTSRWLLSIPKIVDKQPGSISCDIDSFADLPIQKASFREEFLSKSRKWKTQFQDLTYNASDRLEGWIDDQIIENPFESLEDTSRIESEDDSYDEWIDNLDIDSSEEFNRMNKRTEKKDFGNEKDFDPWI